MNRSKVKNIGWEGSIDEWKSGRGIKLCIMEGLREQLKGPSWVPVPSFVGLQKTKINLKYNKKGGVLNEKEIRRGES